MKRAADERRHRSRKAINEKKEKYWARNGFLRNTSTDLKRATFVILINHAMSSIRKERLSPMKKGGPKARKHERGPVEISLWKGHDARQSRKLCINQ